MAKARANRKAYFKKYYQENKERYKEKYKRTREQQLAQRKRYYAENKDKLVAYMQEYRKVATHCSGKNCERLSVKAVEKGWRKLTMTTWLCDMCIANNNKARKFKSDYRLGDYGFFYERTSERRNLQPVLLPHAD